MRWILCTVLLAIANDALGQNRSPSVPPVHMQPRRSAGAAPESRYQSGHEARGARDELAPVGEMRRKLRPPELLAEALSTPQDAFREGQGWPLARALGRANDRAQQVQIAQLYWKLAGAQAEYHFARQQSHQLWKATERHAAAAAVQAARFESEGAVGDCEVSVVDAQHELAEAMRLSANDPLPLAIDRPHVGEYKTQFENMFAGRTPPARLRLTNRSIPVRRKAIDIHSEAILAASDALDGTIEEFERGSNDLSGLLSAFNELDHQRRTFVRAVRDYNQDIAEYALSVAPQGAREEALVAMLIRTPTPRMAATDPRGERRPRREEVSDTRGAYGREPSRGAAGHEYSPERRAAIDPRTAPRDEYGAATGEATGEYAAPRGGEYAAPRGGEYAAPRGGDRFASPDYAAPPSDDSRAAPANDYRGAPAGEGYTAPRDGSSPPREGYSTPRETYGQPPIRDDYRSPAGRYDGAGQEEYPAGSPTSPQPRYAPPAEFRSSQAPRPLRGQPTLADPRDDPAVRPASAEEPVGTLGPEPVDVGEGDVAPAVGRDPFSGAGRYESQKPVVEPAAESRGDDPAAPFGSQAAAPNGVVRVFAMHPRLPENTSEGEYGALESVKSPALRAQRLAGLLHWWQRNLPPDAGRPTSLPQALAEAPPERRLAVITAYWRAREAAAHYQALAEAGDHLAPLSAWASREARAPAAANAMLRLQAARLGIEAALLDAQVGLLVAEYNLAVVSGVALEEVWPLPTTIPHAGRYHIPPSHLVHRSVPYSADHLPPLEASLQELAAAVVYADLARAETMHPSNANPAMINTAVKRVYTQLKETQKFLRTQTEYNLAIADYALRTLPAGAPAAQVVSRLVIARNLQDGA